MRIVIASFMTFAATGPALAASESFFSLRSTEFVVMLAFLIFVGILLYLKVPGLLNKALDGRAEGIKSELDEARAVREEAQTLLAGYERKQKEVQAQADEIIARAKKEAQSAAEQAKNDLKSSIARRMAAAEEQIASAEARAVKEVRDQAVVIAIGAAKDVIAKQMTKPEANKLIDDAIGDVDAKLH